MRSAHVKYCKIMQTSASSYMLRTIRAYLAVVHSEVEMMQRVVRRTIDDLLKWVTGDHIGVMNEDGPDVHANK